MSEDFLKSLFEKHIVSATYVLTETFRKMFPEAQNVEWFEINNSYEAIFYNNDIEIIAKFRSDGSWIETGINRDITELPPAIKTTAEEFGEIMNCIEFERVNSKEYELIVRDMRLTRYLLLLTEDGRKIRFEPWER